MGTVPIVTLRAVAIGAFTTTGIIPRGIRLLEGRTLRAITRRTVTAFWTWRPRLLLTSRTTKLPLGTLIGAGFT